MIISDGAMIAQYFNLHFINITDSLEMDLCVKKYLTMQS